MTYCIPGALRFPAAASPHRSRARRGLRRSPEPSRRSPAPGGRVSSLAFSAEGLVSVDSTGGNDKVGVGGCHTWMSPLTKVPSSRVSVSDLRHCDMSQYTKYSCRHTQTHLKTPTGVVGLPCVLNRNVFQRRKTQFTSMSSLRWSTRANCVTRFRL